MVGLFLESSRVSETIKITRVRVAEVPNPALGRPLQLSGFGRRPAQVSRGYRARGVGTGGQPQVGG